MRKGKLTSAVVVRAAENLFDGFGGEGFIFAEGLDFDGRSHGRAEGEHAEDVPGAGHLFAAFEENNGTHVFDGRG